MRRLAVCVARGRQGRSQIPDSGRVGNGTRVVRPIAVHPSLRMRLENGYRAIVMRLHPRHAPPAEAGWGWLETRTPSLPAAASVWRYRAEALCGLHRRQSPQRQGHGPVPGQPSREICGGVCEVLAVLGTASTICIGPADAVLIANAVCGCIEGAGRFHRGFTAVPCSTAT